MSPWVDIQRASAEVGRDYIYTHKPHPSIVSMERNLCAQISRSPATSVVVNCAGE